MLGPCHADHPRLAPLLPLVASLPALTPRPIGQVVQHVFTHNMATQADRNRIVRAFRRVSSTGLPSLRLERFVDCSHRASKRVEDRHDAWLDPAVMESFVAWRRTLEASAWTHAGQIAGGMTGDHRTSLETVRAWCLERRGYAS